ncbi:gephyrin-like molybdotransferase Glp [uncultured Amnibacterium sp.]|uniref:molybdopterin molybdotransferase MoeA n=1 Tax=uncultured Amnibacterium sp. TaxID=1631851 RepID=UPI0035CB1A0A
MPARRRSVDEHAVRIASIVEPALVALGTERLPIAQAAGRPLAEDVHSAIPLPPFRNAQMDGYAARAEELTTLPVTLPVAGVAPAERSAPRGLPAGHLLRIMTGAPLPDGADCVVPVEDTRTGDGTATVLASRAAGDFVRIVGSDLDRGGLVVAAGTVLAARHLAALAASGTADVAVRARPRVAILTTGAEVVAPGRHLQFGEIYDSNGTALAALAREAGAEVVLQALVDDDPGAFADVLADAVAAADLVVTSGGISQGDYEVVRQVLEPAGAEVTEIAMQPGGPQATAVLSGVPIVCFPGNPVSTQVSFTVFIRPLLRRAAGLATIEPRLLTLEAHVRSVPGKRQWLRGQARGDTVRVVGGASSHLVTTMARADVLIDVPEQVLQLAAGDRVTVLPL